MNTDDEHKGIGSPAGPTMDSDESKNQPNQIQLQPQLATSAEHALEETKGNDTINTRETDPHSFFKEKFWLKFLETQLTSKFDNLSTLEPEFKNEARPLIEAYAQERAKHIVRLAKRLLASIAFFSTAAFLLVWLAPKRIAILLTPAGLSTDVRIWAPWLGILITITLLSLVPYAINWLLIKEINKRLWMGWSVFTSITCGYLAHRTGQAGNSALGLSSTEVATILITPCLGTIMYWGIGLIIGTLAERMDAKISDWNPQGATVARFIDILAATENKERWQDLNARWSIVHDIEGAARAIQYATLKSSGDSRTDDWLRESSSQITAALRALKKKVLLPSQNTREEIMYQAGDTLTCIIEGRWGELTKARPTQPPKAGWREFSIRSFRLLVSAFAPIAVLLFLRENPLLAQMPGIGYLMVGCVVWIALTIVMAIDPSFSERLGAAKELKEILSKTLSNKE